MEEDKTCMLDSPLSRKEKQKLRKKLRRKKKRQQLAIAAAEQLEPEPTPEELAREQEEHDRLQKEWELREQLAQLEWRKKQEKEKFAAENAKTITEKPHSAPRKKISLPVLPNASPMTPVDSSTILRGREAALKIAEKLMQQSQASSISQIQSSQSSHPPFPPPLPENNTTAAHSTATHCAASDGISARRSEPSGCPFYLKIGACRFGEFCSLPHPRSTESSILIFRNLLDAPGLDKVDEATLRHEFELRHRTLASVISQVGEVVSIKACYNTAPHLRGTVYVEFCSAAEAKRARDTIAGKHYAGKQLSPEFAPSTLQWKYAICSGVVLKGMCARTALCNFLHVLELNVQRNSIEKEQTQQVHTRKRRREHRSMSPTSRRSPSPRSKRNRKYRSRSRSRSRESSSRESTPAKSRSGSQEKG